MTSTILTPTKKIKPHATLRQLETLKRFNRWELETKITKLESQLQSVNRLDHPGEWMDIEAKLGAAYLKLMRGL